MLPEPRVRLLLPALACVGLCLAACQGPDEYFRGNEGLAGSGSPGAAGSGTPGAAGSGTPGAAGSGVPGTGGSIAPGAGGSSTAGSGNPGAAGSAAGGSNGGTGGSGTGTGGATGSGGRGGTTGTGGAMGRGGTTGTGGAVGRGGTTGTGGGAGSMGRGGAGGMAGNTGRGGMTGTGGRGGATGTGGGGGSSCPTGTRLDCSAAGSLNLPSDGVVVDFSTAQWNATTMRWCDTHGLGGTLFSFMGTSSTAAAAVDTMMQNLKLNLMVGAGQYAGGGVYFDTCVDASSFNSVQFTATVTSGSLTNCAWQVQLQTQDQRPSTATNPAGGTCASNCSRYPAATLTNATTTAMTYTTRFTAFNNPASSTVSTPTQIVGLQWQVNSGNNGGGTCTVELRIDNVKFVTM